MKLTPLILLLSIILGAQISSQAQAGGPIRRVWDCSTYRSGTWPIQVTIEEDDNYVWANIWQKLNGQLVRISSLLCKDDGANFNYNKLDCASYYYQGLKHHVILAPDKRSGREMAVAGLYTTEVAASFWCTRK